MEEYSIENEVCALSLEFTSIVTTCMYKHYAKCCFQNEYDQHSFFNCAPYFSKSKILTLEQSESIWKGQMCDKGEINYVAKAQNWDQRVRGENESARVG